MRPVVMAGAMLVVFASEGTGVVRELPAECAWVVELVESGQGRTGLRVSRAEVVEGGVEVIAELQYPDTEFQIRTGQVKLYLPAAANRPGVRLPLLHVAGYELDRSGGQGLMKAGFMVSTPHGEERNPLVRGENLDVAILHRVRALGCVDDARVAVAGGSAGGYMALMIAAETFPLVMAQPDAPPLNVGYNCAYILASKPLAQAQPPGQDHVNMPILLAVSAIGEGAAEMLGTDFGSRTWVNASPVGRLAEVTCPTLITISTADLLVPINQYGAELVRPHDPATFPEGFTLDMEQLVPGEEGRQTLLEAVSPDEIEVFILPAPAEAPKLGWDGQPEHPGIPRLEAPFSRERRFSLVVLDEGPVEPQVGHLKRLVDIDKSAFHAWALSRPIDPEQLTDAKLRRLMKRLLGQEAHPQVVQREEGERVLNRLDFPEAERADVLRGLRTFCLDAACAARLQELYRSLPQELRALGAGFAEGAVEDMVRALRKEFCGQADEQGSDRR